MIVRDVFMICIHKLFGSVQLKAALTQAKDGGGACAGGWLSQVGGERTVHLETGKVTPA